MSARGTINASVPPGVKPRALVAQHSEKAD
jgi:hypothetical protein